MQARVAVPRVHDLSRRAVSGVRAHVSPWFAVPAFVYLVVASLLVFWAGFVVPDAWSRVGNAAYMIAGRDPHLAAIGFVWNPLPSLLILPLVAIRDLWSPLVSVGFAANLVSVVFMAGSVLMMNRIAVELRVPAAARRILVALFAVHPMIVLYGANGMSEAPFVFLLLVVVSGLLTWWRTGGTTPLAVIGIALGLAYLTRYEAVAAAVGALAVVGARSFQRAVGDKQLKRRWAIADVLVAGLPFGMAFAGWALASLIITGNPFETFTSVYGNSSQVSISRGSITDTTGQGLDAIRFAISEVVGLAPTLPILALVAGALALVRRRLDTIVPIAVFGAVLGFAMLTTVTGSSFAWLRFSIAAIPLAIVLAFLALATIADIDAADQTQLGLEPVSVAELSQSWLRRPPVRGIGTAVSAVVAVALVAVCLPVALGTMTDPRIGREEVDQIGVLIDGRDPGLAPVQQVEVGRQVAAYVDGLTLADGAVVLDVAVGFPIFLHSKNPRQFVITPDRDFERVVADPKSFGASYLLAPSGSGYSSLDAVSRAHPGVFANGAGIATLVHEFGTGIFAWRLFQVT